MRAVSPVDVVTAALLGSGFVIGFRLYGNGMWIVAVVLVIMMSGQRVLLRVTQGNVIDQSVGPRARAVITRNLFPFLFAVGLWANAFVPHWYTQGDALVIICTGTVAVVVTAAFAGVVSIVFALGRNRIR